MFAYNIAYRFVNGEIQGFIGYGFTEQFAKENANKQIINKIKYMNETFDTSGVIDNPKGLSKEEYKLIKNDWKLK